jgi:hypothetical protein
VVVVEFVVRIDEFQQAIRGIVGRKQEEDLHGGGPVRRPYNPPVRRMLNRPGPELTRGNGINNKKLRLRVNNIHNPLDERSRALMLKGSNHGQGRSAKIRLHIQTEIRTLQLLLD